MPFTSCTDGKRGPQSWLWGEASRKAVERKPLLERASSSGSEGNQRVLLRAGARLRLVTGARIQSGRRVQLLGNRGRVALEVLPESVLDKPTEDIQRGAAMSFHQGLHGEQRVAVDENFSSRQTGGFLALAVCLDLRRGDVV